jgi:hypothetical protein
MICIGLLTIVIQIKRFKTGLKDEWGYQKGLVIWGIGIIVMGVILIVKSF